MKESYTLKLKGKEWKDCLDKVFDKKKKDLKVDGFRKGQVPKEIYIKKFGIESLYMDAVDMAVDLLYAKLLSDEKTITPVVTPEINIKNISSDEVEIEFILIGAPEIKLGKYKNLGIKKEKISVTEDEINTELNYLKEQFKDLKTLDDKSKIKNGTIAIINFEGFKDGKPFDGGKANDYSLEIGSNTFIPGFEDGLIGLKKGDKKDLELTFPENYQAEDLKGKKVIFKVEIVELKEKVYPEFNEDFFEDLAIDKVKNIDELKKYIKDNIKSEKEAKLNDEHFFKCLDEIVKNSKFDIPVEMTTDEVDRMTKEFDDKLKMQGMNLDNYLKFTNSKLEDFKSTLKEEANKRIGYRLVVDEIVKIEKLEITEEELNKEVTKAKEMYGINEEDLYAQLGSKEVFRYNLLMKEVMELVTNNK